MLKDFLQLRAMVKGAGGSGGASGGGIKMQTGTLKVSSPTILTNLSGETFKVTHNLGVKPSVFIMHMD